MPRLFATATIALLLNGTDATPQGHWVSTWSGAMQPFGNCCSHYNLGSPEFRDAFEKGVLDNQTIRIANSIHYLGRSRCEFVCRTNLARNR